MVELGLGQVVQRGFVAEVGYKDRILCGCGMGDGLPASMLHC